MWLAQDKCSKFNGAIYEKIHLIKYISTNPSLRSNNLITHILDNVLILLAELIKHLGSGVNQEHTHTSVLLCIENV